MSAHTDAILTTYEIVDSANKKTFKKKGAHAPSKMD